MKKSWRMHLQVILFPFLLLIVVLQLVGCSDETNNTIVAASPDKRADQFAAALKSIGYGVSEGSAHLIDPAEFVNYHVVDSAAGNNAGQPYKRLQILPFGNQQEDPNEKAMGIFRLQPYEAVVYVGPTPPHGDYFSFTAFLWSRFTGSLLPKGDWIFAALGDPLNSMQIKVEGGGSTFQKNTIVIFTADKGVNDAIVAQAKAAGYPESMINTYILPSKLLYMGTDDLTKNDSFLILVRTANVYDPEALKAYNSNDHYARVFRVTPGKAPSPLQPYDTPLMANRKAQKEDELVAPHNGKSLSQSLDDLKEAIIKNTPHLQVKSFESSRWFAESRDILLNGNPGTQDYHKFVAGEAADTPYLRTSSNGMPDNFVLGPDDMVVVYGVNHQETGLATYSNFSVYSEKVLDSTSMTDYLFGFNNPVWSGITGLGSKDGSDPLYGLNRFGNSAYNYLPLTNKHGKYLYAVRVLRQPPPDPDKKPWITVPEPTPQGGPATGVVLTDPMAIGYRAYVNPQTTHGPDYGDIIPDRALWFKVK